MKTRLVTLLTSLTLLLLGQSAVFAQSGTEVQGKWTLKKNHDRWGDVTQLLEVKGSTFTYKVQSKSGDTLLQAKGALKLEKLGPFQVMKLTDIEGAYGDEAMQSTNDDRTIVYSTGWNTLTLALNFDQYRDGEKAEADTYTKVKSQ